MDFYKRLGIVCRAVPEGKVITYGQAALLCGYPKNARQVGYGLKKELAGDVPAYKVVNSQGVLSGAASFEHPGLQRILLEEEGSRTLKVLLPHGPEPCASANSATSAFAYLVKHGTF